MMEFRKDRFTTQKGDFTIEYPPKAKKDHESETIRNKSESDRNKSESDEEKMDMGQSNRINGDD